MRGEEIGVIGAGRVGTTLGARWAEAGYRVAYGVRDPGEDRHDPLRDHAQVVTVADAVAGADVVLLALPWAAVRDVAEQIAVSPDQIVVDATNPVAGDWRSHDRDPERSGAEAVAEWLGYGRVVKAFNSTGAGNMQDPGYRDVVPMMPIAADDEVAKGVVAALASSIGFDPVDAGPLTAARDLEHLAMLWIRLAYQLGNGPDIAFALLRRE